MFCSRLFISALTLVSLTHVICPSSEDTPEQNSREFVREENNNEAIEKRNLNLSPAELQMILASMENNQLPPISFDPNALRVMSMEYSKGIHFFPDAPSFVNKDYALLAGFLACVIGGGSYILSGAHGEAKADSFTGLGPKISVSLGMTVGAFVVAYLLAYLVDSSSIAPGKIKTFFAKMWPSLREVKYLFGPSSIALGDELQKLVTQNKWDEVYTALRSIKNK